MSGVSYCTKGTCARFAAPGSTLCPYHREQQRGHERTRRAKATKSGDPKRWAQLAIPTIKRRAAKKAMRGVTITAEDIIAVFPSSGQCPVFKVPFVFGQPSPWNPSVDRLDATKGYVPGNIRIISVRANTIKSDATAGELEMIANWIREQQGDVR